MEPDALRERAGEYQQRAGEWYEQPGTSTWSEFGPIRVTFTVEDGGERRTVELTATSSGLTISGDRPGGRDGPSCPHTVTTAIDTWHRTPKRSV